LVDQFERVLHSTTPAKDDVIFLVLETNAVATNRHGQEVVWRIRVLQPKQMRVFLRDDRRTPFG
jgi:hypothetical protein